MHISVLLDECLEYLNLKEDSIAIDMTLGYGGHSSMFLKESKRGFFSPLTKIAMLLNIAKKD